MKPSDHKKITQFTFDQYNDLFSDAFRALPKTFTTQTVQATADEDEKKPLKRFTNWHFYKSGENPHKESFRCCFFIRINLYSHLIYQEHIDTLNDIVTPQGNRSPASLSQEQLATLARAFGGIIHHVQDMSTPSHVTPIYHGPWWGPGKFKKRQDHFEDFSQRYNTAHPLNHNGILQIPDNIPDLFPNDLDFMTIYHQTAEATRQYLRTTTFPATRNNIPEEMPLTAFWQEYDFDTDPESANETAGFGQYGPWENCFGERKTSRTLDGVQWTIAFDTYQFIYFELISKMIADTLRCLRLLDTLLTSRPELLKKV